MVVHACKTRAGGGGEKRGSEAEDVLSYIVNLRPACATFEIQSQERKGAEGEGAGGRGGGMQTLIQ